MATRHQVRQSVVSMLYAREMGDESAEFVDEFLGEKKIRNDQREFTLSLFEGALANLAAIDAELNSRLGKWKLGEIGAVERAILRLGAYELRFTDTDAGIVISEAVALANEFGSDSASRLINAVLDAISKGKAPVAPSQEIKVASEADESAADNSNLKSEKKPAAKGEGSKNISSNSKDAKSAPKKTKSNLKTASKAGGKFAKKADSNLKKSAGKNAAKSPKKAAK